MSEDNGFALIAWIKRDQEERREHESKMALKNWKDDEIYLDFIKTIIKLGLPPREYTMIVNILRHRKDGKNWSPAQKSVIANIYYKHTA